jgi:Na+/H+ antiporter NhaD/arsenite permease-like protein
VLIPGLILIGTYAVLALGRLPGLRLDRTGAAVVGAILMVAFGGLSFDAAVQSVNFRTLVLLFGMMVLVAHLQLSGFFTRVARYVAWRVHNPIALIFAVSAAAGLLSALFVNDPVCLVLTPVVIEVTRLRRLNPLPVLLALATGSNIGSVATITGNPQQMLIGSVSRMSFVHYAAALGPVAVVGLLLETAIIATMFRGRFFIIDYSVVVLPAAPPEQHRALRAPQSALLAKTVSVAAIMLIGFFAAFEPALVAAVGAAALLVTRRVNPRKIWSRIDWDLLVLFVGLFVVVEGAVNAGLAADLFEWLRPIGVHTVWGLSLVSALLANLISNVPSVMLLSHLVPTLPNPEQGWLTLAMSSTLSGNLTLLGSIANLIVVEGARKRDVHVSFGDYLRVGIPVTIATMAFGIWWVY